jgi:hypothetical protein
MRFLMLIAALISMLGVERSHAQIEPFTGHWLQTFSTAGDCPTCRISIRPEGDGFEVVSNNGWSASVATTTRPGEVSVIGTGIWDPQTGSTDLGRKLRLFLLFDGQSLIMQMAIGQEDGQQQLIHANFVRDPSVR